MGLKNFFSKINGLKVANHKTCEFHIFVFQTCVMHVHLFWVTVRDTSISTHITKPGSRELKVCSLHKRIVIINDTLIMGNLHLRLNPYGYSR